MAFLKHERTAKLLTLQLRAGWALLQAGNSYHLGKWHCKAPRMPAGSHYRYWWSSAIATNAMGTLKGVPQASKFTASQQCGYSGWVGRIIGQGEG